MINIIKQKFEAQKEKAPKLSSFVNFMRVIRHRNYEDSVVKEAFNKLVEKDDWKGSKYDELLDYIYSEGRKPTVLS